MQNSLKLCQGYFTLLTFLIQRLLKRTSPDFNLLENPELITLFMKISPMCLKAHRRDFCDIQPLLNSYEHGVLCKMKFEVSNETNISYKAWKIHFTLFCISFRTLFGHKDLIKRTISHKILCLGVTVLVHPTRM